MSTQEDSITDPLTEALLSSHGADPLRTGGEGLFVRKGEEDQLTRALFARLDKSVGQTRLGSSSISRRRTSTDDTTPTTVDISLKKERSAEDIRAHILNTIQNTPHAALADIERQIVHTPLPKRLPAAQSQREPARLGSHQARQASHSAETASQSQAQSPRVQYQADADWFAPERTAAHEAVPRARFADLSARPAPTKKHWRFGRPLFLAGIALALVLGGSMIVSDGLGEGHFFSRLTSAAQSIFALDNPEFFSSKSFTLQGGNKENAFGPLLALYADTENLHDEILAQVEQEDIPRQQGTDAAERLMQAQERLASFFKQNESFSWLTALQALARPTADATLTPQDLNKAREAALNIYTIAQEHGLEPAVSSVALNEYFSHAIAWQALLSTPGEWLFVATGDNQQSPGMGKPASWAEVSISRSGVSVNKTGSIQELNAALDEKIIPPTPVQAYKTAFDFSEVGWFFDHTISADYLARLYKQTTGTNLVGVIVIEESFLTTLSGMQGFRFNPESESVLLVLMQNLASYATDHWKVLADVLKNGVRERILGVYPQERKLRQQLPAIYSGALEANTADNLVWGARSWEEGVETGVAQYTPSFFEDGSIVGEFSLRVRNTASATREAYVMVGVPRASTPLWQKGLNTAPTTESFDYAAHGFASSEEIQPPQETGVANLALFTQESRTVFGGWVRLAPGEERSVAVRYRLPFRLRWQAGEDDYALTIHKTGSRATQPFRFLLPLAVGQRFVWREPQAFASDTMAEYQAEITTDTVLRGTVVFDSASE